MPLAPGFAPGNHMRTPKPEQAMSHCPGPAPTAGKRKRVATVGLPTPEAPAKKQSKWSPAENAVLIELRASGMKWEDISNRLPGRSAVSCRLHYQNFLERRPDWDDEKKNKLARLYERFKDNMWKDVAKELQMPWRAVEAMHWQIGAQGMADRAGVPLFSIHPPITLQPRPATGSASHLAPPFRRSHPGSPYPAPSHNEHSKSSRSAKKPPTPQPSLSSSRDQFSSCPLPPVVPELPFPTTILASTFDSGQSAAFNGLKLAPLLSFASGAALGVDDDKPKLLSLQANPFALSVAAQHLSPPNSMAEKQRGPQESVPHAYRHL